MARAFYPGILPPAPPRIPGWMAHVRLFIPGPVEVSPEIRAAMGAPMIGHRGPEFVALYQEVRRGLQELLCTRGRVLVSTSSSSGVMEIIARNGIAKRALACVNGEFSRRWFDLTRANGKEADAYAVDWGQPHDPREIDRRLATGKYDCLNFIHNETSTGVMNDLEAAAAVMGRYPDVLFCVDAVSSMSGMPIEVDHLGIDVAFAGVQKAFGLPPGLAVFTASEKAVARARTIPARGGYFDLLRFVEMDDVHQTPETPAVAHLFALAEQLKRFRAEGLENRFRRHREMAAVARAWAKDRLALLAPPGFESVTLTAVKDSRGIDVGRLIEELKRRHQAEIGHAFGPWRGKAFRIAHMADTTVAELKDLLGKIDTLLPAVRKAP